MLTRRRPWPPLERARSSCGRREIWELLRRAGAEQGLLCRMDRRSCLGGGLVVSVSGQWRVVFIGRDAALVWPPIGSQACFLLSIFLKKKLPFSPQFTLFLFDSTTPGSSKCFALADYPAGFRVECDGHFLPFFSYEATINRLVRRLDSKCRT